MAYGFSRFVNVPETQNLIQGTAQPLSATMGLTETLRGRKGEQLGAVAVGTDVASQNIGGFTPPTVAPAPTSAAIGGRNLAPERAMAGFTAPEIAVNLNQTVGDANTRLKALQEANPTATSQEILAGVFGGLGQFQGGVSQQDLAALQAQQQEALAHAAGGIKERMFGGGATMGGATNLGAVAASESAANFAQQYADLQRAGREQQLQALGMTGQMGLSSGDLALRQQAEQRSAAQTLGQLGLDQGALELQAKVAQGQLSAEAGRQALEAQGININAMLEAARLAQSGDTAAAQLALQGTGMNIDSALAIADMDFRQRQSAANLSMQAAGAQANILGISPELQAYQAMMGLYGATAPQVLGFSTGEQKPWLGEAATTAGNVLTLGGKIAPPGGPAPKATG